MKKLKINYLLIGVVTLLLAAALWPSIPWFGKPENRIAAIQERGELRCDVTVNEMVRVYALCERALIYDWCLSGGDYSLLQYGRIMMPMFLGGFRTSQKNFVQNI